MDARLDPAPVVASFAEVVRHVVGAIALYAGGSLASGDFHPGVSDLDLVAIIAAPLDDAQHEALLRIHEDLQHEHRSAAKLHCVYVPCTESEKVDTAHLTWAHGRLFERPLSGIARAELFENAIVVYGPPPAELLAPLDRADLDAAVRAELMGYWSRAVHRPRMWLADWCVDLGLVTLARAEAALEAVADVHAASGVIVPPQAR